jgi:hypothetical protein
MHVAARTRLVLARRPWIYWVVVGTFAALAAGIVHGQLSSIAETRSSWGTTRDVLVADQPLEPGDPIEAEVVSLPLSAIPRDALSPDAADGAFVRQRVADGEVLTRLDVTSRTGPAALADPGQIVVALSDPLARDLVTGLQVQITADGLVLAEAARVTGVVDEVIFVAVSAADAPIVAAAAQQGIASLLYLP